MTEELNKRKSYASYIVEGVYETCMTQFSVSGKSEIKSQLNPEDKINSFLKIFIIFDANLIHNNEKRNSEIL